MHLQSWGNTSGPCASPAREKASISWWVLPPPLQLAAADHICSEENVPLALKAAVLTCFLHFECLLCLVGQCALRECTM